MHLSLLTSRFVSLSALICLLAATGCQSSPPRDHGMRGFIIDVAASDEWLENHSVYTMFGGEQITLPAYFEFSPRPTSVGYGGAADSTADLLAVQFGSIVLHIGTDDAAKLTFFSDNEDYALKLDKIITWTVQPLNAEHQVARAAPQSLEELQARIESGEMAHYINMRPAER